MYISDDYIPPLMPVDKCTHVSFNASTGAAYSEFKGFWVLDILFCTFAMIKCDTQNLSCDLQSFR